MAENDDRHELESVTPENRPSDEQLPVEPFPCPACGQLLAPSCRICVACKHTIDVGEIRKPTVLPAVSEPARREPEPVRFPWRIFLIVFAIWVVVASLVLRYMDPRKGQFVLGGVQILCSLWVFYDALEKRLPRPLRWGMGTLLLWSIIFPWYLARRKAPRQACLFDEARVSPIMLAILLILLAVFFFVILKQSPPH